MSVRVAQHNGESGPLPSRFIGSGIAGLGTGINIERVLQMTLGAPFQMLGEGQDPLPEGSSTDARGHKRRHMLSARRRESAPIRPVERALRGILTRCKSPSYREERWG
jgi:hypothetical protein